MGKCPLYGIVMTTSGDHKDLLIMLHKKVHDKQVWAFLFPRTRQAQLGGVQGYGGTVLCGAAEIITLESKGRLCHFITWHIRPFGTKVARYSNIIKHFRLCIYIMVMYRNRKFLCLIYFVQTCIILKIVK